MSQAKRNVEFADATESTPLRRSSRDEVTCHSGNRTRSRSPRNSIVVHDPTGSRRVLTVAEKGVQSSPAPEPEGTCDPFDALFVIKSSVAFNAVLLIAKIYVYYISKSLSVLASVVDSLIDLLAQVVLWAAKHMSGDKGDKYPVGRSRLEPVGVVVCAVIMGMASIEVIHKSWETLELHWGGPPPPLDVGEITWIMLFSVIGLKTILWFWSHAVAKKTDDESVKAVAQDNLNDVLSNASAAIAVALTLIGKSFWVADPIMGILISIYIIWNWLEMANDQVDMLVGRKADEEFLQRVRELAETRGRAQGMQVDSMEAYHFGPKYLVELEMIMPEDTPLAKSHDAGMRVQHEIETEEACERCFVHIDYRTRIGPDGRSIDHDRSIDLAEKLHNASQ